LPEAVERQWVHLGVFLLDRADEARRLVADIGVN